MKLHGNFEKIKTAVQKPSVGNVFEAGLGFGLDLFGGMAVGAGLSEAMGGVDTAGGVGIDTAGGGDGCVADIPGADGCEATSGVDTATGRVELSEMSTGGDGYLAESRGAGGAGGGPGVDTGGSVEPFVGDEIKFSRDAVRVTRQHFSGGVREGLGNIDGLLDKFGDITPEDMKVGRRET